MKKTLALILAVLMLVSLAACGESRPEELDIPEAQEKSIRDAAFAERTGYDENGNPTFEQGDYTDLYDRFGKSVTIDEVVEDPDTGLAYIVRNGLRYELGLDFLSMAMVYNTEVPEGSEFKTSDDIYACWWKYYIQRWNYLLPEIPLYSNEYYDIYNAQIKGVTEHPTNPFWAPPAALIDWTSEKNDTIILGSSTDLSGKFRYASFGATSPGASDNDVAGLVSGLETVVNTKEGGYVWNPTVVKAHNETLNADGTKTFEIEIFDDLKFSDGSAITAKNYLVTTLVFSTPVAAQAASRDHQAAMTVVGFDDFNAYDGTSGVNYLSGLRLLGDYKFSVTIASDYIPYFYDITYAAFGPSYIPMWAGNADIKDDGNGCYLTADFYAKSGEDYTVASIIKETSTNTDTKYPYSGPYVVESYDTGDKSAVLKKNDYFKGNYEGTKPSIGTVVYKKVIDETQLDDLQSGNLDVIAGITGGAATDEAITLADNSNGGYVYTHYSRAGYGKLGMRCDLGPVQFVEVRQAIAYCMDRAKFAKDFTGGYGGVVDGPYYTGSWMYKAALGQGMQLDAYATSADSAIAVLEQGGWIYDANGNPYESGVRYKKIDASYVQDRDITYQSIDGAYKTVQVNGEYYMPLVLNWYGTEDNEFTDLLLTGFMSNENIKAAGFAVQNTIGQFAPMLDELYEQEVYGYYSGTPLYTCFNFATGFNSAVYDYAFYNTINPNDYDDFSNYYIKDMADVYWFSDEPAK